MLDKAKNIQCALSCHPDNNPVTYVQLKQERIRATKCVCAEAQKNQIPAQVRCLNIARAAHGR